MSRPELKAHAFFGRIYLSYMPRVIADSILSVNGRVVLAGDAKAAESICAQLEGCQEITLPGKASGPGFVDAHMHLTGVGLQLNTLDLRDVGSLAELREKVRRFIEERNPPVVIGRGWDHEKIAERRFITRYDIDEVVPDRPAILVRICGHVGTLNTYALRLLKVDSMSGNPDVDVGPDGQPTGIVKEDLLLRALRSLEPPPEEYINYVVDAANLLISQGVTTVGFMNTPIRLLPWLIEESGRRLRVRLRLYLDQDAIDQLEALGIRGGFGNEWVSIMGIKVFADGSLGARTALLSEPYNDAPETLGRRNVSPDQLSALVRRARRLGLDVAVHAIGDGALDLVLSSMGPARDSVRIEHASIVRDEQLPLLKGVRVSVQPMFVIEDRGWLASRLGEGRLRLAYRFRSLISHGALLGLSTDAPVEPTDPWMTVYAAVNRGRPEGCRLAELTPHEALTVDEALYLYTSGSAAVLKDSRVGSLLPGSLADIASFSKDPFEVTDPVELRNVRNVATYVGGEPAYRA